MHSSRLRLTELLFFSPFTHLSLLSGTPNHSAIARLAAKMSTNLDVRLKHYKQCRDAIEIDTLRVEYMHREVYWGKSGALERPLRDGERPVATIESRRARTSGAMPSLAVCAVARRYGPHGERIGNEVSAPRGLAPLTPAVPPSGARRRLLCRAPNLTLKANTESVSSSLSFCYSL